MAPNEREQRLSYIADCLAADPHYHWASGRALRGFSAITGQPHPGCRESTDDDYTDIIAEPRGSSLGAAYVGPIAEAHACYARNAQAVPVVEDEGDAQLVRFNGGYYQSNPVGPIVPRRRWPLQVGLAAIGALVGVLAVILWDRRYDLIFGLIAVLVALLPGVEYFFKH